MRYGPRRLPPLHSLRAFEAAARFESFTQAANELSLTHGAVSRAVRALEDWLGVDLFRRLNRRVELTDVGRTFLVEVAAALDRIALAGAHIIEEKSLRVLRVDALPTFTIRWLIPHLSSFQRQHPRVEVRLTTSLEKVDCVRDQHDLLIRGGPDTFYGYKTIRFLDEMRLPVASPDLLKAHPIRKPQDLKQHALLHTKTLIGVWPDWLKAAGVPDLKSARSQTFEHFYLSIQAAVDGLGIAMGPSALIADDLARGKLVPVFPEGPVLGARSYNAYVPENRLKDQAVLDFVNWLKDAGAKAQSQDPFLSRTLVRAGFSHEQDFKGRTS